KNGRTFDVVIRRHSSERRLLGIVIDKRLRLIGLKSAGTDAVNADTESSVKTRCVTRKIDHSAFGKSVVRGTRHIRDFINIEIRADDAVDRRNVHHYARALFYHLRAENFR